MSAIGNLANRIDAEFTAVEDKVKKFQTEQTASYHERQKRVEQLNKVFDELREIWRPRLEYLIGKFGDRVQTKPRFAGTTREGTLEFQSNLARVRLKFGAFTDWDVRKVILSYDLEIIPVLTRFKPHDEIEFPLEAVDKQAVAQWIDDRMVDFVKTYFSLGENEIYLKDQMVEDPIARVRFPKAAAACTLEKGGATFYFINEETRAAFQKQ